MRRHERAQRDLAGALGHVEGGPHQLLQHPVVIEREQQLGVEQFGPPGHRCRLLPENGKGGLDVGSRLLQFATCCAEAGSGEP